MNFQNFNPDGTGKPAPVHNYLLDMFKKAYGKSVSQMIPDKIVVSPVTFQGLKKQLAIVDECVPPPKKPKKPKKVKGKFKYAASPAYPGAK